LTDESEINKINYEAEILSGLDHPNIVKFNKVHESPYHYFIVMEHLKDGSLWDFISKRNRHKNPLSEQECSIIMKQILEGIAYLHSVNLLHRDLKPANILMKSSQNIEHSIKIADFGLSTKIDSEPEYSPTERCGTRSYMAPELIQGKKYSYVFFILEIYITTGSGYMGSGNYHVCFIKWKTPIFKA